MVNKIVEKLVEKMWMLNVNNMKMWNSTNTLLTFFTQEMSYKRFMQKLIDRFYTLKMTSFNLLNPSFTRFAHRTTNTTTLLNNKEKTFSGGERWR